MASNETACLELEISHDLTFDQNNSELHEGMEEASYNNFENSDFQPDQQATTDIPVLVRSSSNGVLIVDMNIGSTEEEYQSVEISIDELHVDSDEHFSAATHLETGDILQDETEPIKRRFLPNEERRAIYHALLQRSANGKLKRKTTNGVSALFLVPLKTVQRIWKRAKLTPPCSMVDVSHRKTINYGRKRVMIDPSSIMAILLNRRTTLRSLAQALQISHVTLWARVKEGFLRRHSNAIKPCLKEEHKMAQLRFCLSMLDTRNLPHEPKFVGMYNFVHIDEKWFYMTKKSTSYYLHQDEEDPLRTCQSKNFIGKVMFLAAIARPRFDEDNNVVFYGKIGLFQFVTTHPALRRSRNREAGTLETKPITSVKQDTIRAFLIDKVIPKIQAKWPQEELGNPIFIQQDNARTHVQQNDAEFQRAASKNRFDIRLLCQPANSPDLNVLDLGFFNAIQSLQANECARTVDELITAVQMAFEEYLVEKINHVFLTLQGCMRETMLVEGSNDYKIPHMNKARLERNGILPAEITCDTALIENVRGIVHSSSNN